MHRIKTLPSRALVQLGISVQLSTQNAKYDASLSSKLFNPITYCYQVSKRRKGNFKSNARGLSKTGGANMGVKLETTYGMRMVMHACTNQITS